MAFSTETASGASAEINVTPLIDVLLVLLIIFMVIVPVMPRGLSALLPERPRAQAIATPEPPIVVQLRTGPGGTILYELNQHGVGKAALGAELQKLLAGRQEKVLFVRGDRELQFSAIAEVIGIGRGANAERIGILTPQTEAR